MASPRLCRVDPRTDGSTSLADLVARALDHDQSAWRDLVDRLKGVSWKVLYGYEMSDEDRKDAEVERLIGLGAQHIDTQSDRGPTTHVMRDPEGNEFCLH